ncbi:unnamed protein product [Didymodactylos carnosus]|uniref:Trafficking protein particle complex subunit 12 n=1 Tax=Didymodactylos carnosus TaxID=1234261 RepID=A0A814JIE5_9BILA|nr:unnamed protein product [Didymodactylos carnosus]CAF1146172.1 unnamed protein product [Didymodactylos carnosus]CAF3808867.1 unnamed protein product [Didymodactylos carnosus]CAF3947883.1 unnamed protein product [Didymodactylos carnosus]
MPSFSSPSSIKQSVWFAYDPQCATYLRENLSKMSPGDIWCAEFDSSNSSITPQLTLDKYLGDPVRQLTYKHFPTEEPNINVPVYDSTKPEMNKIEYLENFLSNQCWRSAIDWTTTYFQQQKQQQSAEYYHLWFIRFACLVKIRHFQTVETEFESFGNLYSRAYVNQQHGGSILPFTLRLLYAEMPYYSDKPHDSLDRLFRLLMMCNTIISVTNDKKQINDLWCHRRLRVLYSISNCYVIMKRIDSIVDILEQIAKSDKKNQHFIYLLIARVLLQFGDEINAQKAMDESIKLNTDGDDNQDYQLQLLLTKGLFALFRNDYDLCNETFLDVLFQTMNVKEQTIATNNNCVCLLYMSQMKEALRLFEFLIHPQPPKQLEKQTIHESVIYNICTIYELESFRFLQKKCELLHYIHKHVPDGFQLSALKLQTQPTH